MNSTDQITEQLRIKLASNHSYNWRRAARNMLLILFAFCVCALAVYGLCELIFKGIEAAKG